MFFENTKKSEIEGSWRTNSDSDYLPISLAEICDLIGSRLLDDIWECQRSCCWSVNVGLSESRNDMGDQMRRMVLITGPAV